MTREQIAELIRSEYDPKPRHWKGGATWDDGVGHIADVIVTEIERIEKERFKFETALMVIGEGIPQAADIAKAALTKQEKAHGIEAS